MFNFPSIKDGIYIVLILALIGGAWYILQDWHYGPIKEKDGHIISLERQLLVTGSALNTCENNLTKQTLDGFIEGIGENNEIPGVDLDDLHT